MTYDLYLFQPEPGVDPLETVERLLDEEDEYKVEQYGQPAPDAPPSELQLRQRELAKLLMTHNPALAAFNDLEDMATLDDTPEQEVEIPYGGIIELDGPEDGNGIQITFFDTTISITIPYWHTGRAAQAAFQEIWGYLMLLEREASCRTYDPQLGKILDLAADFPVVLAVYVATTERAQRLFSQDNS